jgi:uncharacterized protein YybS (DUF2232 family)
MSGSAEEQPKRANQPPGDSFPLDASEQVNASEQEAAWLEAEAALSRPVQSSHGSNSVQEVGRSSATLVRPRMVDPLGPLMMVETAFLASAASLLWLINYYFPMGPLLRIFFPIPIALTYLRWGNRAAWMGALVSGLLLSVLMGPARSILYVIPYGVMGVLLGVFWQRAASWGFSIFTASLLGSVGFFFRIWLVSLLLGDDLWLYATTQVTDLLDWIFIKLGLIVQPSLWLVQLAIVVLVILSNIVYLFVVHLVAWFLLDRLGNPIPRPPKWVQVLMDYE